MQRAAFQLFLALALFVGGTLYAHAGKRVAFVVGNDDYVALPKLRKAVNDSRAVAGALKEIGFTVITGENLTRRNMNRRLADLLGTIAPGDQVFFFFAGHGVALGAENYLIPSDMPKPGTGQQSLVRDEGYAVSSLVNRVRERGARSTIFVLDACRDNPFASVGVRSIGGARGLTRVEAPNGVFMLFSAGIGQTALDRLPGEDVNPNSVFTRKLVPLLLTPGLSHVSLAKRVQEEVDALARSVGHAQQPAYYDQIIGNIVLRPGSADQRVSATSAPLQAPINGAAQAWNAVKDTKTASDLEAFIGSFPNSFFAKLARSRLARLKSSKTLDGVTRDKPAKTARERIALVIGNGTYGAISDLANVGRDSASIQRSLKAIGYEVIKRQELTASEILAAVREFSSGLRRPEVEAGLVYYAGHGTHIKNQFALLGVDAKIESEEKVLGTLSIPDLLAPLSATGKPNVVLLDAALAGPSSKFDRKSNDSANFQSRVQRFENIAILVASTPGTVAMDQVPERPDIENSPFTHSLMQRLTESGVSFETLAEQVANDVLLLTKNEQKPWHHSNFESPLTMNGFHRAARQ